MAVLVTKRWSPPRLSYNGGGMSYSEVYDVSGVSDVPSAKAALIGTYPVTAYNATSPYSPLMYVSGYDVAVAGFGIFVVTVTYSTNPAGRHVDPNNPLSEPVQYRFEWNNTTEPSPRDTHGNVIQNTANQSFTSDVPTDVLTGTLYAERNEPFYDAIGAVAFSNAVNSVDVWFHGIWKLEKGRACSRKIDCLTPITGIEPYVRVRYAIELRGGYKLDPDGYYDGFKARICNEGTVGYYSDGGTKKVGPIVEVINGSVQNVSSPVRLDKTGKPIQSAYKIGKLSSPGYADPVASPAPLPATTVLEDTGDAVFVKVFPEQIKLLDLNALGL